MKCCPYRQFDGGFEGQGGGWGGGGWPDARMMHDSRPMHDRGPPPPGPHPVEPDLKGPRMMTFKQWLNTQVFVLSSFKWSCLLVRAMGRACLHCTEWTQVFLTLKEEGHQLTQFIVYYVQTTPPQPFRFQTMQLF